MALGIFTNKTDQELVQRYIRRRDERSFRELYRRHSPAMYVLALRLTNREADAEDALQDAWIRACRSLAEFQWRSSLRTWLTGILINCVRELKRKHERRAEEQITDHFPLAGTVESQELNLENVIGSLPNGYRQILVLHDVEGYTHEEIGRLLDINVGTSKSQLHHARKVIKALLSRSNHDERI